jgi:hypothetical protein
VGLACIRERAGAAAIVAAPAGLGNGSSICSNSHNCNSQLTRSCIVRMQLLRVAGCKPMDPSLKAAQPIMHMSCKLHRVACFERYCQLYTA